MIVIGITGSIGMGKSIVAAMLRDMNIPVHDSDTIVHKLLNADGLAVAIVGAAFPDALQKNSNGKDYIDRTILSKALSDDQQIKILENTLHPLVFEDLNQFKITAQQNGHKITAFDMPLLFESGAEHYADIILCVSAPEAIQRERVLARPNMTPEKFAAILARQMPDAKKRKRSDIIIDTSGDLHTTRQQLEHFIAGLPSHPKVQKL